MVCNHVVYSTKTRLPQSYNGFFARTQKMLPIKAEILGPVCLSKVAKDFLEALIMEHKKINYGSITMRLTSIH